jgi:hypothetical protein
MVTTSDKYPLSNMPDLSNGLHGGTIFAKIYLVKGHHRIPVVAEDIPKTAIIMSFGLFYICLRLLGCPMLQKLTNA